MKLKQEAVLVSQKHRESEVPVLLNAAQQLANLISYFHFRYNEQMIGIKPELP